MHPLFKIPNSKTHQGFTLLEILVAMVLLAITIATASTSLKSYMRLNYDAEARSEATHAAQSVLDELRYTDVETMPTSGTVLYATKTMDDDRNYQVEVTYCKESTYCTSNSVRHISVTASYNGEELYSTETVYTDLGGTEGGVAESPYIGSSSAPSSSTSSAPSQSKSPAASLSPYPSPSTSPLPSASPTSSKKKKKCKWWKC